jgi:hypothetical protein
LDKYRDKEQSSIEASSPNIAKVAELYFVFVVMAGLLPIFTPINLLTSSGHGARQIMRIRPAARIRHTVFWVDSRVAIVPTDDVAQKVKHANRADEYAVLVCHKQTTHMKRKHFVNHTRDWSIRADPKNHGSHNLAHCQFVSRRSTITQIEFWGYFSRSKCR